MWDANTYPCLRYLFLAATSSNTGNLSSEPVETKHDDVIKWNHFLRNWPFVRGIHRSPVNSPHKGQWCGALMFCLICARINGWVNNREAGDLRLHRAHYGVTVLRAVIENCRHCVRYISMIFRVARYQLNRMMSHLMTERIFIFHLIFIIKSEGWTHGRCGGGGHVSAGCIVIFHKYCCYIKYGGIIIKFDSTKSFMIGGISLICQNTTMRVYGAWIRIYKVLCSKTYSTYSNLF